MSLRYHVDIYLTAKKKERDHVPSLRPLLGSYSWYFHLVSLARAQSPDISLLGTLENVALFWTAVCPAINQSFCFEKRIGGWLLGDKNSLCHRYLLGAFHESLMAQFISASAYLREIEYIFQQLLFEGYLHDLWEKRHSSDRKTKQKEFLYNKRNGLIGEKSLCPRSK